MNGNNTLKLIKIISISLVLLCIALLVLEIVSGYTGFNSPFPTSNISYASCNNSVGTKYNNTKFDPTNLSSLIMFAFIGNCIALAASILSVFIAFAATSNASSHREYAKSNSFADESLRDGQSTNSSVISKNAFIAFFILFSIVIWLTLLNFMRYSDIVISSSYSICPITINSNIIYAFVGVAALAAVIAEMGLISLYYYKRYMVQQAESRYQMGSGLRSTEYIYDDGYNRHLIAKGSGVDIHSGRELLRQQQNRSHFDSYNSGNRRNPKIGSPHSHLQDFHVGSRLMPNQGSFSEYNSRLKDVSLGAGHATSEVKTLKEQLDGSWKGRIDKINSGLSPSIAPTERYSMPIEKQFFLRNYQQQQLNAELDVGEHNLQAMNWASQKRTFDMNSLIPQGKAEIVNKEVELPQERTRHREEATLEDQRRKERKMRHSRGRKEKSSLASASNYVTSESNKTVPNAEKNITKKNERHRRRSSSREQSPSREKSRSHKNKTDQVSGGDSEEVGSLKYSESQHSWSHRSRSKHSQKRSRHQNVVQDVVENKNEEKSQKSSHNGREKKMEVVLNHPKFQSEMMEMEQQNWSKERSGRVIVDDSEHNRSNSHERKDKSERERKRSRRSSERNRGNHHINQVTLEEYSIEHIPKIKKAEQVILTNKSLPKLDHVEPVPKREKIRRHHRHRIEEPQVHPTSSRHRSTEKRDQSKSINSRENVSEVISRKSETVERPNGQTVYTTREKREIYRIVKGSKDGSLLNQNPLGAGTVERANQKVKHKTKTRRHRSRGNVKQYGEQNYERRIDRF